MSFRKELLSENSFTVLCGDTSDDLLFAADLAAFIRSYKTSFSEFEMKLHRTSKKYSQTKLATYPNGSFKTCVDQILTFVKKLGDIFGEMGNGFGDIINAINDTAKVRTNDRQKLVGDVTTALSTLKSSRTNLDKAYRDYLTKARAEDESLMAVIKAQENLKMKPKDIAKIEQKQEKTNAAYLIAADGYEYQLELTNNRIFEAYNIIFPDLLTAFENFKLDGMKHYQLIALKIKEIIEKAPKKIKAIVEETKETIKAFDPKESLSQYIKANVVQDSRPKPCEFLMYSTTTHRFEHHKPKPVPPFQWSESGTVSTSVEPRHSSIKTTSNVASNLKKNRRKSFKLGRKEKKVEDATSGIPIEEEDDSAGSSVGSFIDTSNNAVSISNVPSSTEEDANSDFSDEDAGIPIEEEEETRNIQQPPFSSPISSPMNSWGKDTGNAAASAVSQHYAHNPPNPSNPHESNQGGFYQQGYPPQSYSQQYPNAPPPGYTPHPSTPPPGYTPHPGYPPAGYPPHPGYPQTPPAGYAPHPGYPVSSPQNSGSYNQDTLKQLVEPLTNPSYNNNNDATIKAPAGQPLINPSYNSNDATIKAPAGQPLINPAYNDATIKAPAGQPLVNPNDVGTINQAQQQASMGAYMISMMQNPQYQQMLQQNPQQMQQYQAYIAQYQQLLQQQQSQQQPQAQVPAAAYQYDPAGATVRVGTTPQFNNDATIKAPAGQPLINPSYNSDDATIRAPAGQPLINPSYNSNDATIRAPAGQQTSDPKRASTRPSRPASKRATSQNPKLGSIRNVTKESLANQLSSEQLHDGTIKQISTNDISSIVSQLGSTTLSMTDEEKERLRKEFGTIDTLRF